MKKIKKMLSLALAGVMMLSSMVVSAGAVDIVTEDIAPEETESYEGFYAPNPLGGDDIYVSAEDVAKAATAYKELVDAGIIDDRNEDGIMPLYGDEKIGDNYSTWDYSFMLSSIEGLSTSQITRIKSHAYTAKTKAESQYDVDTMIDSSRHFMWNFLGAKDSSVGAWCMRVECNNYEWAHLCHAILANHYKLEKQKWINKGVSDFEARAFQDTVSYFKTTKTTLIQAIKDGPDYNQFAKTVDESSAMDFWNNQKDREWAQKSGYQNTSAGAFQAYKDAYGNGGTTCKLIDSTRFIQKGSSNYRTLFNNTSWWSH